MADEEVRGAGLAARGHRHRRAVTDDPAPHAPRPGGVRKDAGPDRLVTLDAVRGVAVMGILLLNIVDFAMPGYAYVDPHFYGGADGANWWSWAGVYILADGKMRGLFTMMFGASTVLIAERAVAAGESPARVHYARMIALFAIGMIHAWLIWSGDILVLYSLCGAAAFVAWRWPTRRLLAIAAALMAFKLVAGVVEYRDARHFEAMAAAPAASAEIRREWRHWSATLAPPRETIPEELAAYRGDWSQVLPARFAFTYFMQTEVIPEMLPDTIALMLIGMALFRSGFFSGAWSPRQYRRIAIAGYAICIPLYVPIVIAIERSGFSPVTMMLTEPLHLVLLRPWLALSHAALVILLVRSGRWPALNARIAAVGRAALSNYLGTNILCTGLFCGYGLGWFGYLDRWQLYPIVVAIWGLMLLWSKPWLDRFRHGPFEWLWRSLARWRWQPMRRDRGTTKALASYSQ